jgi:hypothetical protein
MWCARQRESGAPEITNLYIQVSLSAAQLARLPVIVFRLEAADSPSLGQKRGGAASQYFIDVVRVRGLVVGGGFLTCCAVCCEQECPPSSYVETIGGGGMGQRRYANRIYLTEASGAVLGANFMNEFNVIFDVDSLQVAMSKADCSYDDANNRAPSPPAAEQGSETKPKKHSTKKNGFLLFKPGARE